MNIHRKTDTAYNEREDGTKIWYHLFEEYEVIVSEHPPRIEQDWHRHEKIWEVVLIESGEMTYKWMEDGEEKSAIIGPGDVVEVGTSYHTWYNHTDEVAKSTCFKLILDGENKQQLFKTDKILTE